MRVEIAGRPTLIFPSRAKSAPAVVFLHGTGGAIDWVDSEIRLVERCVKAGITVCYPQGLPPDPTKVQGFLSNPYRWNDGSTKPGDDLHSNADDVGFLDQLFDSLTSEFHVDANRLYLFGFSNGAGMTFRFAAEGRTRLAGIAPVAGHCWVDPPKMNRPVRTIAMLGDRDPLIPVAGGTVQLPWGPKLVDRPSIRTTWAKWAEALGQNTTPVERDTDTHLELTYHETFRAVVVPGLGHHWPGGAGQLNPRLGGPKASPIDANTMLWDWFGLSS